MASLNKLLLIQPPFFRFFRARYSLARRPLSLGIMSVRFEDDTFGQDRAHLRELCALLCSEFPLLPWGCQMRADLSDRDEEFNVLVETGTNWGCSTIVLAPALKDSGFRGLVYSADLSADNLAHARENLELAWLSTKNGAELYCSAASNVGSRNGFGSTKRGSSTVRIGVGCLQTALQAARWPPNSRQKGRLAHQ